MMIPSRAGKRRERGLMKTSFPISIVERAIANARAGRIRCLVTGAAPGRSRPAAIARKKIPFRLRRKAFSLVIPTGYLSSCFKNPYAVPYGFRNEFLGTAGSRERF